MILSSLVDFSRSISENRQNRKSAQSEDSREVEQRIVYEKIKKSTLSVKTLSVNIFVGINFRHLPKNSSLFTDKVFNDKILHLICLRLFSF